MAGTGFFVMAKLNLEKLLAMEDGIYTLKNCIYVSIFDSSKQAILGNNFMQIFHTPYYGVTIHAQLATYA